MTKPDQMRRALIVATFVGVCLSAMPVVALAISEPPATEPTSTEPEREPEWSKQAAEAAFADHLDEQFTSSAEISPGPRCTLSDDFQTAYAGEGGRGDDFAIGTFQTTPAPTR